MGVQAMAPANKKTIQNIADLVFEKVKRLIDQTLLPTIITRLNEHDKMLKGNGKRGLVENVAVLKDKAAKLEISSRESQKFMTKTSVSIQRIEDAVASVDGKIEGFMSSVDTKLQNFLKELPSKSTQSKIYFRLVVLFAVGGILFTIIGGMITFVVEHSEWFAKLVKFIAEGK